MKPFPLAVALLIAALQPLASGAAGPESAASGSDAGFARLSEFKPDFHMTRLEARLAEGSSAATRVGTASREARGTSPVANAGVAAGQKYIRLSGFVSISGSQYIPPGSAFAWVNVSGYANLQDQEGHYLGQVLVSDYASCTVSGNFVSCWARPHAEVSIYESGRYLGTVHIEGSVSLTGFHNGGWVNLNGSGYVDGQGYIEDPAPPKNP